MISRASDLIEEALGDIDYEPGELFPFFVRVGCVKMAAPRHPRFEYYLNFGRSDIDKVFTGEPLTGNLLFVFPERFMSVHEQQQFMATLKKHRAANHIDRLDLITSSPLLVGSFKREMIRILTWEDDELSNGRPQW